MSLSPDGDINARAIEFALMQPPTPSVLPPQRSHQAKPPPLVALLVGSILGLAASASWWAP